MRLVTYEVGRQPRVGVVEGENVVDVRGVIEMAPHRRVSRTLAARPPFKAAARQARPALADPKRRAVYAAQAKRQNRPLIAVAISDCYRQAKKP